MSRKGYRTIYVPGNQKEKHEEMHTLLGDIDCTLSKFLSFMLEKLLTVFRIIKSLQKNWRHFRWEIVVKDRSTERWYSSSNDILVVEKK